MPAALGLRTVPAVNGQILTLIAVGTVLVGTALPRVSLDAVALLALATLVIGAPFAPGFDFPAADALRGFGSTTLVILAGMFVLAEALQRTGAASGVGTLVERTAARGSRAILIALLPVVMLLSAVMNNTGVVVLLMPLLVAAGQRAKVSPSRLLLPLSYASITGGTLTLVGTSTTLLVAGLVQQQGIEPLGFLEILPMGVCACVAAYAYLVLAGPRLLPDRPGLLTPTTPETTRQYLTSVVLTRGSRLVGRRLREFPALLKQARFLELVRGEETRFPPFEDEVLQPDDVLLVKGAPEPLVSLINQPGVIGPADGAEAATVRGVDVALAEVMVAPRSRLEYQTVSGARLRERYGVVVLAVLRHGEHVRDHLLSLRLRTGDVLLVQGRPHELARLGGQPQDLILLGGPPPSVANRRLAPVAVAITGLALLLGAFKAIPLSMAVVLGSMAAVAAGCLTSTQAYRSIDLRILVVIGAMFGVGLAAERSGLARDVAGALLSLGGPFGRHGVLLMLIVTTSMLTEIVSNAGTAALMTPIAIQTAHAAHASDRPFVFAVVLAASWAFLTPVGYQTNLIVYQPGGYRLRDYFRLGFPLQVLLWIVSALLLPVFYPF